MRCLWSLIVSVVLSAGSTTSVAAQKLDTVVVINGDRVTGEIKKMERGRLDYSTDDMGRLSIKWDKVLRLWSPFFFEVEMSDGRKYFGSLAVPDRDSVIVVSLFREDTLDVRDVVEITPIKRTFLSRLNGFLDLGFTFARANGALTLNSNGEVVYRGERAAIGVDYNTYVQQQDSVAKTTRIGAALKADYFFRQRWALSGSFGLQSNDELGLELRRSLIASLNRSIVHTNRVEFRGGLGLTRSDENFATSDTNTINLEGLITTRFDWFKYDSPKLDLTTTLDLFPSITTKNRIRVEYSIRSDYELLNDFTIGLQFRYSFDSKPPVEDLARADYTVSFTIGWKFNR
ncbi:MAG: DUF481 domain-containing protein [Gemmatimonadales bacterium]